MDAELQPPGVAFLASVPGATAAPRLTLRPLFPVPGAPRPPGFARRIVLALKETLKRVPALVAVVRWTHRQKAYGFVRALMRIAVMHPAALRWRTLLRQGDPTAIPAPLVHFGPEQVVPAPSPPVFPEQDAGLVAPDGATMVIPPITIGILPEAIVYGASNFVFTNRGVVCHAFYDFPHDFTSEELHFRAMIDVRGNRIRWFDHDPAPVAIAEGAAFLDACSGNYAHWVSEVLPRIAVFCEQREFLGVPLILDQGLHANLLDSVAMVAGADREVIPVPRGRALAVERLYLTSATGYVPFGRRRSKDPGASHGAFSAHAFEVLRRRLGILLDGPRGRAPVRRRLYLRRKGGARVLVNGAEIEGLLARHGFEVVEPETLGFAGQVALFQEAEAVVAPTGAACANLVFCRPGARAAVLMARHREMPYRYWAAMAAPAGVQVSCVLGDAWPSARLGIHSNFRVEERDLAAFLDKAGLS